MRVRWLVALAIALLLLPALATAEEEKSGRLTWLAYSKVKSGKTGDAVGFTMTDQAFYDGLMADGVIKSWGLATPINHRPGDRWNHVQWVSVDDWAGVDAWVAAFGKVLAGRSPEERAELQARAEAIYEAGSHYDEVVRHTVFSTAAEGSAPAQYFYIGTYSAKPEQGEAITAFFEEFAVPIADQLKADGAVLAYGLYVSELHGDAGWTHRVWYALPDLASVDKLTAAFGAAVTDEVVARAEQLFEPDHSDQILAILHLGGAAGEGE